MTIPYRCTIPRGWTVSHSLWSPQGPGLAPLRHAEPPGTPAHLWSHQASFPPSLPLPWCWWSTSCCRSPAEPLLLVHRAAHAAGRGTGCRAGSWRHAGRGQRGRCNRGCRGLCTPPQGPVPGTAEDTDHPPGGTAPLSGTPCPLGTGLHEKTERISARSAGKGQVMEEQWGSCPQMPGWPPAGRAGKPKEAPPTCSNIWGVTSKHSWLCLT